MKRPLLIALFGLLAGCFWLITTFSAPVTVRADGTPSATLPAPSTANQASNGASPQQILDQAQQAAQYADRTVNIVNSMLAFLQVGSIIIAAALGITGTLISAAGIRTIREYSAELVKTRNEMAQMRTQIQTQAEDARTQADKAVRALTLLQLGDQQLDSKNMKSARRTFLEAYKLDPDNRAINYYLTNGAVL